LAGITFAPYDGSDSDILSAVGPACFLIRRTIEQLGATKSIVEVNSFWRPFVSSELQVVIGRFLEFKQFEQTGFIGVGDAIGLTELSAYLDSLGLQNTKVAYADRLDGDALRTNLISVGGPDANLITKEAINKINSKLRCGDPKLYQLGITDSLTGISYAPSYNREGELIKDYGVIIKAANPFALKKHILLIFGSFGYGSWAASCFAVSNEFVEMSINSEEKSIELGITQLTKFGIKTAYESAKV
jgi:hypothetical protein